MSRAEMEKARVLLFSLSKWEARVFPNLTSMEEVTYFVERCNQGRVLITKHAKLDTREAYERIQQLRREMAMDPTTVAYILREELQDLKRLGRDARRVTLKKPTA